MSTLKTLAFLIIFVITGATIAADAESSSSTNYDLLIRGGELLDGTGAPARRADILVRGDQIARIGLFDGESISAEKIIDATGKVVTPGFIDTHSHGDPRKTPEFENFIAMGVTTICLGQDGASPSNLAQWMQEIEGAALGPNIAMFVGHGSIRTQAGIPLQTEVSASQVADMQRLVGKAMKLGCFGMTTGLEYQPGSFSNIDELVALAKPVANGGGLVMSHMRTEDDDAIDGALSELLAQGEQAGCPVHVSHIKVTYGHGATRAEKLLAQLKQSRSRGIRVTADIYPYTASYTGIGIVFPDWAKPPHNYADVANSRRTELAEYLRRRVTLRNGPEATLLGTGKWAGKTLAQVAADLGKPFEDVLIDDIGLRGAQAAYFVMDAELQDRLLVDPHVMICSDGSPTSSHPRGHGAFARVMHKYVVDENLIPIEEAIRKMTGLPAETVGLDRMKRGKLIEGYSADILIFDPDKVRDNATYESPRQLATGFARVIVNGKVVREDDQPTANLAGKLLKRSQLSLEEKIDELFVEFDQPEVPGASVAIYQDGKILLTKAYGHANIAMGIQIEPRTNFRLASVTKQFTAMCIMMLKEHGQLGYDDPIIRFFPNLPPIAEQITIRQLLWHTSGLIDYENLIPPNQVAQLKDRDVLNLLKSQHGTYFSPGTRYRYSNTGYALLALIVEKVSKNDFATFLKENIFLPLGMNDTVAFEDGKSTVPKRAFGYRESGAGFIDADQSLTSAVLGDGGIYTSVLDYQKWDESLYGTQLISRETLEEAFSSGVLNDGSPTGYGFGWRINKREGVQIVHHNGGTCGFSTAVRRLPTRHLTVAVLTNRAGKHAGTIADQLLTLLLNER
ncbi:MAG: D-aminoacylase [Phycisphaerae bacterium]|nr:MAG: D-aminoacylase [Phycisphaerae bacterium]